MGHVQQSTTLASAMQPHAQVSFLTKSSPDVVASIESVGFEVLRMRDDAEILAHLKSNRPNAIVFDKLDVEEGLAESIRKEVDAGLVIFTNLTAANRHADLAVMAGMGSDLKNIDYVDPETRTRYLFGPRYWVLRPEFHEYHARGKRAAKFPSRILLLFGGSDPADLTSAALNELLGMEESFQIDVVLGNHFMHDDSIQTICARHSDKMEAVHLHRNVRNIAELMYHAELAMVSPGLSAFEALRVGTPLLLMPQNPMQETYRGLMRMIDRDDIHRLHAVLEAGDFTYPTEPRIEEMAIGEGIGDLISAILRIAAQHE